MVLLRKLVPVLLMSLAFVLAGCTDGGGEGKGAGGAGGDAPPVEATSTTGGIRGVVVDERITPIKGALIEITGTTKNVTTGEDGLFAVSGLEAGTYFVRASHPLYASAQQSVDVVAGEENPESKRILLTRTVFSEPYFNTLTYDGFIVCSANAVLPVVGGVLSEECGEGVGVPGVGRVGGQASNNVQFDFYVDGPGIASMVVEQVWDATGETSRGLVTPISLDWVCDPFCGGNTFASMEGESPLIANVDSAVLAKLNLTSDTRVSTFTWASPATTPIGVTLQQKYTIFVTNFYFVPTTSDWSFVQGSPSPY